MTLKLSIHRFLRGLSSSASKWLAAAPKNKRGAAFSDPLNSGERGGSGGGDGGGGDVDGGDLGGGGLAS